MRILLVEDYPPIRKAVAKALREAGLAVDSTADGLGLALVQRAADALGGSVSARVADGMFTVRLLLPLPPSPLQP